MIRIDYRDVKISLEEDGDGHWVCLLDPDADCVIKEWGPYQDKHDADQKYSEVMYEFKTNGHIVLIETLH